MFEDYITMLGRATQQASNHLKISLADITGKARVTMTQPRWRACSDSN